MVELYLIRHGIAAERGTYTNDDDRPLTPTGIKKTQQVAQRLADLSFRFSHVLTSPLVRAQQTANILHQQGLCSSVELADCLAPEGRLEAWLEWLSAYRSQIVPVTKQNITDGQEMPDRSAGDRIALVGHQPDLGWWAESLVWGHVQDVLVLKKAGIIGVLLPDVTLPDMHEILGTGQMFWLTAPKLFL